MQWLHRIFYTLVILTLGSIILFAHDDPETPDGQHDTGATDVVLDFTPTYYEHIKPIIAENCLACHQDGQIAQHIALDDATVIASAKDIDAFVSLRYMPPWMPSQASLPLQHDRSLSDYDIALIHHWAQADAPTGDPAAYVEPDTNYVLTEIREDQILQLETGYTPQEDVFDDYRCFAFSPNIEETTYLTGYEFSPDVAEMVHHGILYKVDSSAQAQIERLNESDGDAGWSCYSGTMLNVDEEEFLATWTPGTFPLTFPEGTGYLIEPDDIYVLQIHYNLLALREPDRTAVKLQYTDRDANLRPLITYELQAPVEIPCPDDVTGEQCERDWAVERAADLYGEGWLAYRPDGLLAQCNQTLADYANNTAEQATTYCDVEVPLPIATIWGVYGHMHELGTQFQMELNPDTDEAVMILDIPNWDFHWQDRYQLVEPLRVRQGDVVRISCTWDNTLSDNPQYVVWGEGTQDEMCFSTLMVTLP